MRSRLSMPRLSVVGVPAAMRSELEPPARLEDDELSAAEDAEGPREAQNALEEDDDDGAEWDEDMYQDADRRASPGLGAGGVPLDFIDNMTSGISSYLVHLEDLGLRNGGGGSASARLTLAGLAWPLPLPIRSCGSAAHSSSASDPVLTARFRLDSAILTLRCVGRVFPRCLHGVIARMCRRLVWLRLRFHGPSHRLRRTSLR